MTTHSPLCRKQRGQGIIEFAGAMIVATMIVSTLIVGMRPGNWLYDHYQDLFNLSGNFLPDTQQDMP